MHRFSGSAARGIFLGQGSNLCLLCWHAASLSPSHQGNPILVAFRTNIISLALQVRLIIISLLHGSTYATSFPTSALYVPYNTPGNIFCTFFPPVYTPSILFFHTSVLFQMLSLLPGMLSVTHDILVYLVKFSSCSQILH